MKTSRPLHRQRRALSSLSLQAFSLVSALCALNTLRAADVHWVGPQTSSPSWTTFTNWSHSTSPKSDDDIIITATAAFNPLLQAGVSTIASLHVITNAAVNLSTTSGDNDFTLHILGDFVRDGTAAFNFRVATIPRLHILIDGGVIIGADVTTATGFGVTAGTSLDTYSPLSTLIIGGLVDIRQTNASGANTVDFVAENGRLDGGLLLSATNGTGAIVNIFNRGGEGGLNVAFLESATNIGIIQASRLSFDTNATLTIDGMSGTHNYMAAIRDKTTGAYDIKLSINKTGANTQILSGSLACTGSTTISGGVLLINGNASSATGAVSVLEGGALGGTGTLGGAVTICNYGTLLGSAGQTLHMRNGLTLAPGANLNVSLGAPSTATLLNVTGNLTLDGILNITDAGGFGAGLYRLINYSGALTDNGMVFGAIPGADGASLTLSLDTATAGQVNLINAGDTALLYWNNSASGRTWAAGSTAWLDTGNTTQPWGAAGDTFAIFRGTGESVTVTGAVDFAGIQFAADGYALGGDGSLVLTGAATRIRVGDGTLDGGADMTAVINTLITGVGGIEKSDFGTLILTAANTYAGTTRIAAGTLLVNGDQSAATGAVLIDGLATLGGTGHLGGSVTALNQGILLGAAGSTLTMGGLAIDEGARLDITINTTPNTTPMFQVNGNVTLNGWLDLRTTDAASTIDGSYSILNYTGALNGAGLKIGHVPEIIEDSVKLAIDTSTAGEVNLLVTFMKPYWVGADGLGGSGVWSAASSSTSWESPFNVPGEWLEGRAVFRGATPGVVTVDNSAGDVSFASMRFETSGYMLRGDELKMSDDYAISTIQVGENTSKRTFTATIESVITGGARLEKTGGGALILTGSNSYTGGTVIRGGVLDISSDHNLGADGTGVLVDGGILRFSGDLSSNRTITLGAGGGILDTGTSSVTVTWAGDIAGAGALTKTGGLGTLVLSGTKTLTGLVSIETGRIHLDGANLPQTTIQAYGSLSGSGVINGTLRLEGVISPTAITVNGAFTIPNATNAVFEAVLGDNTGIPLLTSTGAVTLNRTLRVLAAPGVELIPGTVYTLITTSGTIGGAFTIAQYEDFPVMFNLKGEQYLQRLDLRLEQKPFAHIATSFNQESVGSVLDGIIADRPLDPLILTFDKLWTAREVRAALNELSPLRYSRWYEQSAYTAIANVRSAENRLAAVASSDAAPKRNIWTEYNRRETRFNDGPNLADGKGSADTALIGGDIALDARLVLGVAATIGSESLRLDTNGSDSKINRFGGLLYAQHEAAGLVWQAAAGADYAEVRSRRIIAIPNYGRLAESDSSMSQFYASARFGKRLDVSGIQVLPYAGLQWLSWKADGFMETGADAVNLQVESMSVDSLTSRLGMALAWSYVTPALTITPRFDFAWRFEFRPNNFEMTARLDGRAFTVTDKPDSRFANGGSPYMNSEHGLYAGLGLDLAYKNNLTLYARLNGDWSYPVKNAYEINIGCSFRF